MKYTLPVLALAAASLANPVPATADDTPPAYRIVSATHGGNGCPQGSIDLDTTWNDSGLLPIRFGKDFVAKVGATAAVEDQRAFCQIALSLEYSPGFSFAIYRSDIGGYGDLDAGVSANVQSLYYLAGQQEQVSTDVTYRGSFHGKWYKSDDVALATWSPCGGSVIFNARHAIVLQSTRASATGKFAATKEGGGLGSNWYFAWKKC